MKSLVKLCLILTSAFVFVNQSHVAAQCDESWVDSLRTVVYHPQMSFHEKLEYMADFNGETLCSGVFYKLLFPLFNDFLAQGKRAKNDAGILFCYSTIAGLHLGLWEKEQAETYLDSAAIYAGRNVDMRYLAPYCKLKGQYIQRYYPYRIPEAVSYYQKALTYYEESVNEGRENVMAVILRNLIIDGFQRNDSASIFRNISKLEELQGKSASAMLDFVLTDVKTYLYDFYHIHSQEEAFLDSAICCAKKGVEICENGLLSQFYKHVAIDLYVMTAELMNRKKDADPQVIDSLLHIAGAKYDPADSIGIARICQAKAKILFERKMIDSAETAALKAQKYLAAGYRNNYYLIAKANIDLIRDIYEAKGDYKKVIEYNDLWMKTDEEIRANGVKELELQYEMEAKEAEINRLDSDRIYQEHRYKTVVMICVLLCLMIIFTVLLIKLKRHDFNSRMALIHAEKEETKLKLKLKEEQTIKMQLEKYDVLSDFYLKEMELIVKAKDINRLREDKKNLDEQVELYRQKVESYETIMNKEKEMDENTLRSVIEDLKQLIKRKIKKPSRDEYLYLIEQLNYSSIETLRKTSNDGLSLSYLKYCICFVVGMEIAEVAECFSIELSSVHMIRYRLKRNFRLGNDDDLGLFLRNCF
jgi:preprotein translocase subunit Sss1